MTPNNPGFFFSVVVPFIEDFTLETANDLFIDAIKVVSYRFDPTHSLPHLKHFTGRGKKIVESSAFVP